MPFKFHGGVHPNYMKAPDVPVTVIAPPPQVVLPMMQHIGAPCKPLVAVGDYVKMGQKIADNPAPVSAPIHATVSGKVIAIEPRPASSIIFFVCALTFLISSVPLKFCINLYLPITRPIPDESINDTFIKSSIK